MMIDNWTFYVTVSMVVFWLYRLIPPQVEAIKNRISFHADQQTQVLEIIRSQNHELLKHVHEYLRRQQELQEWTYQDSLRQRWQTGLSPHAPDPRES